ncbi:hypothetical protein GCM10017786_04340 [Amycolatopsis deserti]|uniref:ESX-1 secretion-associated protein n=1 Tax=Amycolatopsis deserti TaxID=185696 RepID=A0ABQ3IC58_9PSEU|nr:hypothetical protein [Amycolatopsis deserti]GHE77930.1 hypothetical protein GCM10017786_04340 [Amycolatopsis deserti]
MAELPDHESQPGTGFDVVPGSLARAATGLSEASDTWRDARELLLGSDLRLDWLGALARRSASISDGVRSYQDAVAEVRLNLARGATVLAESELTLKQIAGVYAHVDEEYASAFGYRRGSRG